MAAAVSAAAWVAVVAARWVAVATWEAGASAARLPEVECVAAVRSSRLAPVFLAAARVCAAELSTVALSTVAPLTAAPSTAAALSTADHLDRAITVSDAGGADAIGTLRLFITTVRTTPSIHASVSASGCGLDIQWDGPTPSTTRLTRTTRTIRTIRTPTRMRLRGLDIPWRLQ